MVHHTGNFRVVVLLVVHLNFPLPITMPPTGHSRKLLKIQVDYANHLAIESTRKLHGFKFVAGFYCASYAVSVFVDKSDLIHFHPSFAGYNATGGAINT